MIVYRFEKKGIGPYLSRRGASLRPKKNVRAAKKYNSKLHEYMRAGTVDRSVAWKKAHSDKKYMFGCNSKEQLKAYFGGEFKPLFREGFRIKRYNVPDEEIVDLVIEVAFPVRYHKFQSVKRLQKAMSMR